ncbi:FAD-dependent oxidoreductase [Desulfosediminicola sp.]|uniref:FAD-dependent oxidoreductase n=1 Tax=Desulfosediminicola sp. TaxID=2886825 RepID=UPI003AF312EC
MAKVIFGAWDNRVIDNREKKIFEIEDYPEFTNFDEFNPGNPVKAFFGGHGFFIFEKNVNLLDAAFQHMGRVTEESCGKCTPCRVGTQIITTRLKRLIDNGCGKDGRFSKTEITERIEEIREIAEQVRTTSLCGLGQTATVALLAMIRYFEEELIREAAEGVCSLPQKGTTYVSAPCIEACPSRVDVPRYIDYVKDGKFTHSLGVILQKYPMAATCGRVCVRFCEIACRRTQVDEAVGIKILKRFVADHEKDLINQWFDSYKPVETKDPELKIAVIGAGPAGISAAYHLLLRGYKVDIFEAKSVPGGMAYTGIPEYRLPKSVLSKEVSIIESLGGRIFYDQKMGRDFTMSDLMSRGYKSVFLAVGAHKGKQIGVSGEDVNLEGYDFGVDFLLRLNRDHIDQGLPLKMGKKVVVVGGGNVAMDCARSSLRLGVEEVHLVYRRSRAEMPADHEEVEAAEKEGVQFHYLTNPVQIFSEDGKVCGMELIRMELGEPDESGRRGVSPVAGSEFTLDVDQVIPAIGQAVELGFVTPEEDHIEFSRWGTIKCNDDTLMTSRKGVFGGGDAVTGPATLVQAMAQGERGARSMADYLTFGRVHFDPMRRMSQLVADVQPMISTGINIPVKHEYRVKLRELDPEVRKRLFEEVEKPISVEEAYREADRCMRCYRVYSVITEQ